MKLWPPKLSFPKRIRIPQTVLTSILVVLITVPLGIAALHPGYAGSKPKPEPAQIWAVNEAAGLAARVNTTIEEFDASIPLPEGGKLIQDGLRTFIFDKQGRALARVDEPRAELMDRIHVPEDAQISASAGTISILEPRTGKLWAIPADGPLEFDVHTMQPFAELGPNAQMVTTDKGSTVGYGPNQGMIVRQEGPRGGVSRTPVPYTDVTNFELTTVGERPVILDRGADRLLIDGQREIALSVIALHVQQPGPENKRVLIATGDTVMQIELDEPQKPLFQRRGGNRTDPKPDDLSAGGSLPRGAKPDARGVSRPVRMGNCIYGAWGISASIASQCQGQEPRQLHIVDPLDGGTLEINHNSREVVVNNLANGQVYLPERNLRQITGWETLVPPEPKAAEGFTPDALADMIAGRTAQNHAPQLVDDVAGIRPGRTSIIRPLLNDSDSDADILTIEDVRGAVPPEFGDVKIIEHGRALQVTASEHARGSVQLGYIASDGRAGGVSMADLTLRAIEYEANRSPDTSRRDEVAVELGESVSFNVADSWADPDGDPLKLVSASADPATRIEARADGELQITADGGKEGERAVRYEMSDGRRSAFGTLWVSVRAAGTLNPLANSDRAEGRAAEKIELNVLENDEARSAQSLRLTSIRELDGGVGGASFDATQGTVSYEAAAPGSYYVEYTVAAGGKESLGIARFDVRDPNDHSGELSAAQDVLYLEPGASASIDLTANDVAPGGGTVGVSELVRPDAHTAPDLAVELRDGAIARVSSRGALSAPVRIPYTAHDGHSSAVGELLVVPVARNTSTAAPRAHDDAVTVRASSSVAVDVLANDESKRGQGIASELTVDAQLLAKPEAGEAFVDGSTVRYLAPEQAGTYTVSYGVTDADGRQSKAKVTFTVLATNAENHAPDKPLRTVRVLAGSTSDILFPLTGNDPDGDFTRVTGISGTQAFGTLTLEGPDHLRYTANEGTTGAEEFKVTVEDSFGASVTGVLRVVVMPRPAQEAAPAAADDEVTVRPGQLASVHPLRNDASASGAPLRLHSVDETNTAGATVSVLVDSVLSVQAPANATFFSIPYEVVDEHGRRARAFVHVTIDASAPLASLEVPDVSVQAVSGQREASVIDLRSGVLDPSGGNRLNVTLVGDAEGITQNADGTISVTPMQRYRVQRYTVRDPETGAEGSGILVAVPAH